MNRNKLDNYFLSYGLNHFQIDQPLLLALEYSGLSEDYSEDLSHLGEYVGGDYLEILDYVDKVSPPRLHLWDVEGKRFDWVQLNPAHRKSLEDFLEFGVINRTFVENAPWMLHFAMGYLIADPGMFCTLTLTNQTAYALFKYGDDNLKKKFLPNYLQKDGKKAWYGATFYTEIQGGSDLGSNKAVARKEGAAWRIDSEDKYFASNVGVADGALVTARPQGNPSGAKGLVLFFVPALREDGSPNYTIRQLKNKFGTRAVPTGEVVLQDSEAYLVGSTGTGIYQALEVLILARLGNAVGALGIARKAYLEALLYTQKRHAFGKPLFDHPLVKKDLLEMEVELEANLLLGFKAVEAFNKSWKEHPPYSDQFNYARFLAHLTKNTTAEMSAWVSQMAMELFGGIGFMEDFPIARWHREALVTPIWEGSSNIQALDMLESIFKKKGHLLFFSEMEKLIEDLGHGPQREGLCAELELLRDKVSEISTLTAAEAEFSAKDLLRSLGQFAMATYLCDAGQMFIKKNRDFRFRKIAEIYMRKHLAKKELSPALLKEADELIRIDNKVEE